MFPAIRGQLVRATVASCPVAYRLLNPTASSRRTSSKPRSERPSRRATEDVLRRVQGEFLEMPGLRLTEAAGATPVGPRRRIVRALLGALVDAKFLFRTRDGAFMRVEARHARREPVCAPESRRRSRDSDIPLRGIPPAGWTQVFPLSRQPAGRTTLPYSPGGRPSGRRPRPIPSAQRRIGQRGSESGDPLRLRRDSCGCSSRPPTQTRCVRFAGFSPAST